MVITAKVVKKVALWSVAAIVGFALLLLLLAYIFENDIKKAAINGLNENLTSPVKVGEIDFSFIRHFPNASLSFTNVEIQESFAGSKENFAKTAYLGLLFNPFDLWRGNYRLKRILIKDAAISLRYDENGIANYNIWKSSEANTSEKNTFNFSLDKIDMLRVTFSFEDAVTKQFAEAYIKEGTFSGMFNELQYDLSAHLIGNIHKWQNADNIYINNKNLEVKGVLQINNNTSLYKIKNMDLVLEGAPFSIQGSVQQLAEATDLQLKAQAKETSIRTLLALLPEDYRREIKDFKSNGNIWFNAEVTGLLSEKSNPVLKAGFGIKNADISHKGSPVELKNTSFSGSFTNGSKQSAVTSELTIKDFKATLNGRKLEVNLHVLNFSDPFVKAKVKTNLQLADLHSFYKLPGIQNISGEALADITYTGKIGNASKFKQQDLKGNLQLKNMALVADNQPKLNKINAMFNFDGKNLDVPQLEGFAGKSDFHLTGNFKNVPDYIFSNGILSAGTKLKSNYIDLSEIVYSQQTNNSSQTETAFKIPEKINFDFQLDISKVEFNNFTANNVSGNLKLNAGEAVFNNLSMQTMQGNIALKGNIKNTFQQKIQVQCKANMAGIEISELFRQLNNFDQDFITNKHVKGKLNADVDFGMLWEKDLTANMQSIVAQAKVDVNNGELIQFSPVVEIGKFLKTDRLNHIYFDNLANVISIKNQQIFIPQMQLNSSATNMAIAGTHTFDNKLNYKVDMNASQLVMGKVHSYEDEFGIVEVKNSADRGVRLFLNITGTEEKIKVAYDAAAMKNNVKSTFKDETKDIGKLLNNNKNENKIEDKTNTNKTKKPKEDLNKVRKGYELEWDDE